MELSGSWLAFAFALSHTPRGENRIHPRGDERLSYVQNNREEETRGVCLVRGPVGTAQSGSYFPGLHPRNDIPGSVTLGSLPTLHKGDLGQLSPQSFLACENQRP